MKLHADIIWKQNGAPARASFSVGTGVTALIGPSGAGKTTIARLLAGLETPLGGTIRTGEEFLFNRKKNVNLPAAKRNIVLVAQDASLFPHLTVAENIRFAPTANDDSVAQSAIAMGCQHLLERNPETLSGGEKRRIAIARALAAKPSLIILDEPMTGLDPKARAEILPYFAGMAKSTDVPVLMISHQLEDMLSIADDAILVDNGHSLAQGSLEQVLQDPRCAEVLGLSDAGQLLRGTVTGTREGLVSVKIGEQELLIPGHKAETGSQITMRVFASDVSLAKEKLNTISILNQLTGTIQSIKLTDDTASVRVELTGGDIVLESRVTRATIDRLQLSPAQNIVALIKAVSVKDFLSSD